MQITRACWKVQPGTGTDAPARRNICCKAVQEEFKPGHAVPRKTACAHPMSPGWQGVQYAQLEA